MSDRSHDTEIEKMTAADELLSALPRSTEASHDDYRLSERPFYIKLCEARAPSALDSGMVPGMYVPLALWGSFLRSDAARGERGGTAVTWENCRRRFNNGEFTKLLRSGWIGSAAEQTETLSEIIEAVLASGRMLILAHTLSGSSSRDYLRDEIGRFTTEDDVFGAV